MKYTLKNLGCWIDGGLGITHAMCKMMFMMQESGCKDIKGLGKEWKEYMANKDTWEHVPEWLTDATAKLQEVTEEGLVWDWSAGDLILMTEAHANDPMRDGDCGNAPFPEGKW